jgi:hypothetical protein
MGILLVVACVLVMLAELRAIENMMNMLVAVSATELIEQLSKRGQSFESGGSATRTNLEVGGLGDIIRVAPYGIFSALFRPLPGEVLNPFGMLAGLEDLAFLIMAVRAAVRMRRSDLREMVVSWSIAFLLLWSFFYGFISSHNMGTAVRYRVQILPLEILLLLYLGRPKSGGPVALSRPTTAGRPA